MSVASVDRVSSSTEKVFELVTGEMEVREGISKKEKPLYTKYVAQNNSVGSFSFAIRG